MSAGGADRKLKVLLFGPVPTVEEWSTFQKKLTALHQSKSGPFDVAFVVGPCAKFSATASLTLPIPVYVQEGWNPTTATDSSANAAGDDTIVKVEDDAAAATTLPEGIVELAPNLYWLRGTSKFNQEPCGNIWRLDIQSQQHRHQHHLVVAVCPSHFRSTDEDKLLAQLRHASYIGCDLLLTNEGPQGIETTIMPTTTTSDTSGSHNNSNWLTSYDIAQVALLARARYHVAASCYRPTVGGAKEEDTIIFHQSQPFSHLPSLSSTRPILHHGRFLNLAPVTNKKQSKQMKVHQKFVHALGIIPLHEMNSLDWQEQQPTTQVLPCPFTDASYELDGSSTTTASVGLSEAQARRLMANYGQPNQNRWELNSRKRKQPDAAANNANDDDAENATSTTLFVHGMHLDVSGELQRTDSILLLQAFSKYHAVRIRRPQGGATTTSYAFVEFETHEQALACLQDHPNGTIVIQGVTLTLKWAKRGANKESKHQNGDQNPRREKLLLTEQEARDSSTLYFRYLDRQHVITQPDKENEIVDDEGSSENPAPTNALVTKASEVLRKLMEHTLEKALMGDDADNAGNAEDSEAVTAATEPALQVSLGRLQSKSTNRTVVTASSSSSSSTAKIQRLDDEDDNYGEEANQPHHHDESSQTTRTTKQTYWFGFLQFASHAAASMALASLTGSIQGGLVQPDQLPLSKLTPPAEDDAELHQSSLQLFQGGLVLRWAPDGAGTDRPQKVDPWAELGLQRRHFPPDARTDCWFCLASPTCERHLITGVYHDWYLTLPKGPVHPGHMLLVPVAHSSRGAAQLSNSSHLEFEDLVDRLRAHAQEVYDRQLFVFERAFQTRGGYHTHVQCIPIEQGLGFRLQSTLLAASSRLGMNLREISSDIPLATILSTSSRGGGAKDDDGDVGYFYAEVPTTGTNVNRLLYTAKPKTGSENERHGNKSVTPPVQFGREALAAVLNQPDLAHWKACLVDQEKETELATTFRQSFAKFAPPTAACSKKAAAKEKE